MRYEEFSNGNFKFNGTLTLPENSDKNTKVVLMVTGSGQQNRDEEVFGNKPFAVIADALACEGIAREALLPLCLPERVRQISWCRWRDWLFRARRR